MATRLSDVETKELIRQSQSGSEEARTRLVELNLRLVWSIVGRFLHLPYERDDLFQIGCIGLMKSIDKFDLSYDVRFSTYAVPMIIGEIRRFVRDDGAMKVSRTLKETANKVKKAKEVLTGELGREPTISEIAGHLQIGVEDVVLSTEANRTPSSIHEAVHEQDGDPILLVDRLTAEESGSWFDKITLKEAIAHLSEREKVIVYLRYFQDKTQAEVADRLGISQVQVSRLEKRVLSQIRTFMRTETG